LPTADFNSYSYCKAFSGDNKCLCFPTFKPITNVNDKCSAKSNNPSLDNCLESKTDVLGSECGMECCDICLPGFIAFNPKGECLHRSCPLKGCKYCQMKVVAKKSDWSCKICDKGFSRSDHQVYSYCTESSNDESHFIKNCKYHRITDFGVKKCYRCFESYILAHDESECLVIDSLPAEGCRLFSDSTNKHCAECLPGYRQTSTNNDDCFKEQT